MDVTLFIQAGLYPAMPGWADPLEGLSLPAWQRLLERVTPVQQAELPLAWLAHHAGVQTLGGWAQWCGAADGLPACAPGQRLCVTPVHLAAQRDQLVLHPPAAIKLDAVDASAYLNMLNQHFKDDGVVFHAPTPTRWYVDFPRVMAVETHPPFVVAGHSIDGFLPRGADARLLARWLTEIQMLLYQHPLHDAHNDAGRVPVNSVWWWGEGESPAISMAPWQHFFGTDELWMAFAQQAGMCVQACPRSWCAAPATALWEINTLLEPWQAGDIWAWRNALQLLEQAYLAPLWQAWQAKAIQRLTVCVSGQGQLRIWQRHRRHDWAWWRRTTTLTQALCLG